MWNTKGGHTATSNQPASTLHELQSHSDKYVVDACRVWLGYRISSRAWIVEEKQIASFQRKYVERAVWASSWARGVC